ncbi:MAG: putative sugar transporter, permease protein, partial [Devosia sp.]|nr:putative sugar transporter, permease protein [Devosia sp.]
MSTRTAPIRLNLCRFVVYATLAFAVCFYGIPLLWLFIAGTRSEASLLSDPPFALGTWEAFTRTWNNLTSYNNFQIVTWATNSLIYSVGGVLLSLVASIPGGYALALSEFRGRKLILLLTLIAMITPSTAVVLPIFLEMNLLGLSNTYAGMFLASGFFPFGVYMTYLYFSSSLPKGVMDSARV